MRQHMGDAEFSEQAGHVGLNPVSFDYIKKIIIIIAAINNTKPYNVQYVANSVEKAILDEALHHIGPKCFPNNSSITLA